jgi:hypothetical protein
MSSCGWCASASLTTANTIGWIWVWHMCFVVEFRKIAL